MNLTITHIIAVIIFYFATKPITNIIGSINKLGVCLLLMIIIINNLLKYFQVIHYTELVWVKIILFIVTFIQILVVFIVNTYIHIFDIIGVVALAILYILRYEKCN